MLVARLATGVPGAGVRSLWRGVGGGYLTKALPDCIGSPRCPCNLKLVARQLEVADDLPYTSAIQSILVDHI